MNWDAPSLGSSNRSEAHGWGKCPFVLVRVWFLIACFPHGWRVAKCVHNQWLKDSAYPEGGSFSFRQNLSFAKYWCATERATL